MVEIKDLSYKWKDGDKELLNIDYLHITRGERVFLKGSSGSGKSTLLNLLSGMIVPKNGTIKVLDQTINALKPSHRDVFRANHMGYIFQTFNLVPYLSVLDNVMLPIQFSNERLQRIKNTGIEPEEEAKRLLQVVGLEGSDLLNKSATELSVGQQQRVAACRALLGSPELIIADEPTSSLDEDAQEAFINLLLKECTRKQTTLLFVSHDIRFTKYFTKVIELKNGSIKELLTTNIGGQ
ncbi:ABC transporter ATP-binding protein [Carboxylicivirga mesophila]|uniref:ABC transporter ATP-binding protein n=2 Tax=Carboxylicivirga TaxID=1628153 RepID=A0A941F464_9BACT|nr:MULTISPECIES: ABC transporter ATP-binding protein [Carboxylicivirga]MBR8536087.1 ABC transporter ATP-binding protein [Carboxylicivirga sediminis]MBS2210765.1 ABC transporter ATP-binding protein [Carboxylicivirga mesophila]